MDDGFIVAIEDVVFIVVEEEEEDVVFIGIVKL